MLKRVRGSALNAALEFEASRVTEELDFLKRRMYTLDSGPVLEQPFPPPFFPAGGHGPKLEADMAPGVPAPTDSRQQRWAISGLGTAQAHTQTGTQGNVLEVLPTELVQRILGQLDWRMWCVCSQVCYNWRVLASAEALWTDAFLRSWGSLDSAGRVRPPSQSVKTFFRRRWMAEQRWLRQSYDLTCVKGHSKSVKVLQLLDPALFGDGMLVSGSGDGTVKVLGCPQLQCMQTFRSCNSIGVLTLHTLTRGPARKILVGYKDGSLAEWNLERGELRWWYTKCELGDLEGMSITDGHLATFGADKDVLVYDTRHLHSSPPPEPPPAAPRADTPPPPHGALTCDDDKHTSAVPAMGIDMSMSASMPSEATHPVLAQRLRGHDRRVTCVCFDGTTEWDAVSCVSGSADFTVRTWDVATGTCRSTLTGHTAGVTQVAQQGHMVFSASKDKTVRIWDTRQPASAGATCRLTHAGRVLCFQARDRMLVTGTEDNAVTVFDPGTGTRIHRYLGIVESPVLCLSFTPFELVLGSRDGLINFLSFEERPSRPPPRSSQGSW